MRLVGDLDMLLDRKVEHPEQFLASLPLLSAAEREQLLVTANGTACEYRSQESEVRSQEQEAGKSETGGWSLHELFEAQASPTPDAIAIVSDQRPTTNDQRPTTAPSLQPPASSLQHLTYAELNARANQLAHYLRSLGVDSETA